MEEGLKDLYWKNTETIDWITRLVQTVRQQNLQRLNKQIPVIARKLQQIIPDILSYMQFFAECGLSWKEDYLAYVLTQLEQAQLQQDYILLGDLYELQLIPALQDVQAIISSQQICLAQNSWWEGNLEVLRSKDPGLVKALLEFEKGEIPGQAEGYYIEPTSTGYFTMALEEGEKRWYLHSNRNPMEEARIWAKQNYRLEKEKYALFGWGMGYHVRTLLHCYPEMDLVVIEPDIGVLYYAFRYCELTDVLAKVKLLWDPELEQLKILTDEQQEALLYRPAIMHVKNHRLQELLYQVADRKDAVVEMETVFYQNIRENIRSCNAYVDALQEKIKGKRVIIVAGGPSLDKNIELLKQKPEDIVILAVGTVYKLLLKRGILVDYVVISDPWVFYQVDGIEKPLAPILLLATADRRISRFYSGQCYLVCQQGHSLAADYAKKEGYMCYSSGGSVATLALDIAIRLRAASIAFVGLDLAYYGTQMHASGTAKENFGGYEFQKAEAWDGTEVNTTRTFLRFRKWLEERIQQPDTDMKIVDATEGGMVKKGFEPMTLKSYLYDKK